MIISGNQTLKSPYARASVMPPQQMPDRVTLSTSEATETSRPLGSRLAFALFSAAAVTATAAVATPAVAQTTPARQQWAPQVEWRSYSWNSLLNHDYSRKPVFVYSPSSHIPLGQIMPPEGDQFADTKQIQISVLTVLEYGDPYGNNPQSGLYMGSSNFNFNNPGHKISSAAAYNALNHGDSVYFREPNGIFQKMSKLDDLQAYACSKVEVVPPGADHTVRNVLVGTAAAGGVLGGGYWLYRRSKKHPDDW